MHKTNNLLGAIKMARTPWLQDSKKLTSLQAGEVFYFMPANRCSIWIRAVVATSAYSGSSITLLY